MSIPFWFFSNSDNNLKRIRRVYNNWIALLELRVDCMQSHSYFYFDWGEKRKVPTAVVVQLCAIKKSLPERSVRGLWCYNEVSLTGLKRLWLWDVLKKFFCRFEARFKERNSCREALLTLMDRICESWTTRKEKKKESVSMVTYHTGKRGKRKSCSSFPLFYLLVLLFLNVIWFLFLTVNPSNDLLFVLPISFLLIRENTWHKE